MSIHVNSQNIFFTNTPKHNSVTSVTSVTAETTDSSKRKTSHDLKIPVLDNDSPHKKKKTYSLTPPSAAPQENSEWNTFLKQFGVMPNEGFPNEQQTAIATTGGDLPFLQEVPSEVFSIEELYEFPPDITDSISLIEEKSNLIPNIDDQKDSPRNARSPLSRAPQEASEWDTLFNGNSTWDTSFLAEQFGLISNDGSLDEQQTAIATTGGVLPAQQELPSEVFSIEELNRSSSEITYSTLLIEKQNIHILNKLEIILRIVEKVLDNSLDPRYPENFWRFTPENLLVEKIDSAYWRMHLIDTQIICPEHFKSPRKRAKKFAYEVSNEGKLESLWVISTLLKLLEPEIKNLCNNYFNIAQKLTRKKDLNVLQKACIELKEHLDFFEQYSIDSFEIPSNAQYTFLQLRTSISAIVKFLETDRSRSVSNNQTQTVVPNLLFNF